MWTALFDQNGTLRSASSEPPADELPEGWTTREFPGPPEGGGVLDDATLTWLPVPADEPQVLSDADVDRIATALAAKLRG